MTVLARGCAPILPQLQLNILEKLANGESRETTAQALGISTATLRREMEEARDALGCDTTLQVAAVAGVLDWITIELPIPCIR